MAVIFGDLSEIAEWDESSYEQSTKVETALLRGLEDILLNCVASLSQRIIPI